MVIVNQHSLIQTLSTSNACLIMHRLSTIFQLIFMITIIATHWNITEIKIVTWRRWMMRIYCWKSLSNFSRKSPFKRWNVSLNGSNNHVQQESYEAADSWLASLTNDQLQLEQFGHLHFLSPSSPVIDKCHCPFINIEMVSRKWITCSSAVSVVYSKTTKKKQQKNL